MNRSIQWMEGCLQQQGIRHEVTIRIGMANWTAKSKRKKLPTKKFVMTIMMTRRIVEILIIQIIQSRYK